MRRHSDEDLLRVMREVAARHGRCSLTAFDRDRRDGLVNIWPQTISHRFSSWDAALIRAGLPLNHSEHAVVNIIHICQRRVFGCRSNVCSREEETLPEADSIRVGSLEFEAAWVRCRAQASFKPDEAFVRLDAHDVPRPLGFYVDRALVRPGELGQQETDGQVKVVVLGRQNGSTTVQVPGEPVSYGPRITLSNELFSAG